MAKKTLSPRICLDDMAIGEVTPLTVGDRQFRVSVLTRQRIGKDSYTPLRVAVETEEPRKSLVADLHGYSSLHALRLFGAQQFRTEVRVGYQGSKTILEVYYETNHVGTHCSPDTKGDMWVKNEFLVE